MALGIFTANYKSRKALKSLLNSHLPACTMVLNKLLVSDNLEVFVIKKKTISAMQEIEKEQLQRRIELIKEKKLIDSLIKDVQQGEYEKLDNFFKEKPQYSEYKEIINDLIKTRKEKMKNKEEQEKIATSNIPRPTRTRSSGRVTKKNSRYVRGGKKSKSKKKRLVKTKRKNIKIK